MKEEKNNKLPAASCILLSFKALGQLFGFCNVNTEYCAGNPQCIFSHSWYRFISYFAWNGLAVHFTCIADIPKAVSTARLQWWYQTMVRVVCPAVSKNKLRRLVSRDRFVIFNFSWATARFLRKKYRASACSPSSFLLLHLSHIFKFSA